METSQDRTYRYDDLNQLSSSNEPGTANDRDFERDQVGNLSEIRRGQTTYNRAHNTANELTSLSTLTEPNALDQAHDAAGNMIVIPSPKVAGTTIAATYDAWNRLVELGSSDYRYDGLNQRITRIEPSTGTTEFYYNKKSQVLTETDGSDAPKAIYSYWQSYIDAVAVRMRPNDEYLFVHDNQYSVTSAVNRENREVVERYRYSPYGETTVLTPGFTPKDDNTLENEYTYTGRRLDPSGLMYFRARYYSPQLGQFISRDPLGYVDGMSQYRAYFIPGGMDPSGTLKKCRCSKYCNDYSGRCGGSGTDYFGYTDIFSGISCETACDTWGKSWNEKSGCYVSAQELDKGLTADQTTVSSFCTKIATKCGGKCSVAQCEKDLSAILNAIEKAWIINILGVNLGINTCERWAFDCESRTFDEGFQTLTSPCFSVNTTGWSVEGGVLSTRHAAVAVEMCDGTIFYADNGALGGSDHIFFPTDVPSTLK